MGALPDPLKTHKRATTAPKLNEYGRDPQAAPEKFRRQSNYDKDTGYAPFFHALRADIYRLASGKFGLALLMEALAESLGRSRGPKEPRPEWTPALKIRELALTIGTTERTVEREILDLEKRKVAEIQRPGRGQVAIRLLYRAWEALPDWQSNVVDISTGEEFEPEEEGEQEAKKETRVELTKRPQPARAGKSSRSIPVTTGVKSFRFQNDSVVDLSFTAVVQAGELILSSQVPEQWLKTAAKKIARSNGTNNLVSSSRHGRREVSPNLRHKEQSPGEKGNRRRTGESHPRAQEIINLFDPILLKSQSRLLSADPTCLLEACEAVGDTDHNYLVKFVVERAGRGPINSPKHCKHILEDARKHWEKVKEAPADQRVPVQRERRKSLVERAMEETRRRLEKYGEI